jgi:hypothetical protein
MKVKMNFGDIKKLAEYKTLLEKNLSNVSTILDPDAVAMGKDWAWADISYTAEDLVKLLTE